jgi:hypothetical protein
VRGAQVGHLDRQQHPQRVLAVGGGLAEEIAHAVAEEGLPEPEAVGAVIEAVGGQRRGVEREPALGALGQEGVAAAILGHDRPAVAGGALNGDLEGPHPRSSLGRPLIGRRSKRRRRGSLV